MCEPTEYAPGLLTEPGAPPDTLSPSFASATKPMSAVERDLRERVKELGCLYAISRLAQRKDISLDNLVQAVAGLLRDSWQHLELAVARVELDGHSFGTPGFQRSRWRQTRAVKAFGNTIGRVEVCYLHKPQGHDATQGEEVFLKEEAHLLHAVAEYLGRIMEARYAEEHLRTLSGELIRAQESERQRIAMELHDDVAQSLTMLKIGIEALNCDRAGETCHIRQQVHDLSTQVGGIIDSVRRLSYDLLPPGLVQLGLVSTIFRLCEDFSTRHDIRTQFRAEGMDTVKLDFEFQINVYRIVQEALSNVRKHSRASNVSVKLIASHPSILLRVEDDGRGFTLKHASGERRPGRHMGLLSMSERARLLHGTLRINTSPGQGTKILVEIPLRRQR